MKFSWLCLCLCLCLCLVHTWAKTPHASSSACPNGYTSLRLQLHWTAQAQFAGYYAADAFGYFTEECLEVSVVAGGPGFDPVADIDTGFAQFANVWAATALQARARGVKLVIISQHWQTTSLTLVSLKSSEITSPADFKGKKVGVWNIDGLETEVIALAQVEGVSKSEFEQPLQPFSVSTLFNKTMDVISAMTYNELSLIYETINPDTGDLWQKSDLNVIRPSEYGVIIVEDCLITSPEFLAENTSIVKAFIRAVTRGWLHCRLSPEDCVQLMPYADDHQRWMMNEVNRIVWLNKGNPFGVPTEPAWNSTVTLTHSVSTYNYSLSDPIWSAALNSSLQQIVDTELGESGLDVYGNNYSYTAYNWCLKCSSTRPVLCSIESSGNTKTIAMSVAIPMGSVVIFIFAVVVILGIWLKRANNRVHQLEIEMDQMAVLAVVGAPAEHAIRTLQKLKKKHIPYLTATDRRNLSRVISLIASNRLYKSDMLKQQLNERNLDSDVDAFLVDLLVKQDKLGSDSDIQSTESSSMAFNMPLIDAETISIQLMPTGNNIHFTSWDYDIMSTIESSPALSPLELIGIALLEDLGVIAHFNIDVQVLCVYLKKIHKGYIDNPYHNALHAADVTQAMGVLIKQCACSFSPLELLAAIIAALIHDFRHPGVNNNYQMATMSDMGLRYNFLSPLENMHVSEALQLLLRPENNFLSALSKSEYMEFHQCVVQLVLATDMTRHIEFTGQFTARITAGKFTGQNKTDHVLLLQMLLKYADLSNPSRTWATCYAWSNRIMNEFFAQGDKERSAGMTISPFMDRRETNWPKCQHTFISFVVKPFMELLGKVVNMDATGVARNITANLEYWAQKQQESQLQEHPVTP